MRDISDYQQEYLDNPFEDHLMVYRHEKARAVMCEHDARNILEIGCGLRPAYKYYEGFDSLTIIEPSELFCQRALEDKFDGVRVVEDFFSEEYVEEFKGKFDFILISSLLHEIEFPDRFLNLVAKIAKPETIIHVNVPNAKSFHRMLALKSGLIDSLYQKSDRQKRYQQNTTFDADSLGELLLETGFKVLDEGTIFLKFFSHAQMQALLDTNIIDRQVLDGMDALTSEFPEYGSEIYMNARLK